MSRSATRTRKTKETSIEISLDLDLATTPSISTGIGFFDHMLTLFAAHGGFGLRLEAEGDILPLSAALYQRRQATFAGGQYFRSTGIQ